MNVLSVRASRKATGPNPLLGLVPFMTAWALVPAYLHLQPSIRTQHLLPFIFYIGILNAYSVGQMITAHLTQARFPYQNVLIVPLALGVLDSLAPLMQAHFMGLGWPSVLGDGVYQVGFMFMCLGLAVGVYGSFVVDVIVTICDYLDIWCLTIKYPYSEEEDKVRDKGQAEEVEVKKSL